MYLRIISLVVVMVTAWTPSRALSSCRGTDASMRCATAAAAFERGTVPEQKKGGGRHPEADRDAIVMPNVDTLLVGWVEYSPLFCTGDSGQWVVTVPPKHGTTSSKIDMRELNNGDCPGILFPFNFIVYTWTDTVPKNKTDAFDATWTSASFVEMEHFDITKAHIEVQSVDLSNTGNVVVNIVAPDEISGTLTAKFIGDPISSSPQTTTEVFSAGSATMRIDRPALRKSLYSQLNMTWNTGTPDLQERFKPGTPWNVQGMTRYTQYNIPHESECAAGVTDAWIVDSPDTCNFTKTTLKPIFLDEVIENGTGLSLSYGYVASGEATRIISRCNKIKPSPPDAKPGNSFVQVDRPVGSCLRRTPLVEGNSLAVFPAPLRRGTGSSDESLVCGDHMQLVKKNNVNFAERTVADTCPKCNIGLGGQETHIDALSGNPSCRGQGSATDLGNFWTVRID
jgi:hypothetical protein